MLNQKSKPAVNNPQAICDIKQALSIHPGLWYVSCETVSLYMTPHTGKTGMCWWGQRARGNGVTQSNCNTPQTEKQVSKLNIWHRRIQINCSVVVF